MNDKMIEDIYYTLLGQMEPEHCVPGVENAFASGGKCDVELTRMYGACGRLHVRLGQQERDKDVEAILSAMEAIQRELSVRMFHLGMKFADIE